MNDTQTINFGWNCSNCGANVNTNESHTCPTVDYSLWFQEKSEGLKGDPGFAFECALLAFEEELAKQQIQMPPKFAELVEKHFWELVNG